ncbi:MAG: 16S rRNA (guanine(527)-N(7))-methyltransferase RsmG [Cyanobacteria bacterium P01_E01_bin.34]
MPEPRQTKLPSLPITVPADAIAQCEEWSNLLRSRDWMADVGWQPSEQALQQFERLYEAVILGNSVQNLTRLTSPEDFWEKHVWDSLRGLLSLGGWEDLTAQSPNAIDIGSGAGFPGLPIAITLPNWSVTLLDSTKRKVAFIEQAIARIGLSNASGLASRVELVPHSETFDVAVMRAIGPSPVCTEYCLPLLKLGGRAVMYRGHWSLEEETAVASVAEILGGEIAEVDAFTTPVSGGVRHCVVLLKTGPTPEGFPRSPGMAKRQPLEVMSST